MVEVPCTPGFLPDDGMLKMGFFSLVPNKKKDKKMQGMKSVKATSGGRSNLQPTQDPLCRREVAQGCDDANLYSDSRGLRP